MAGTKIIKSIQDLVRHLNKDTKNYEGSIWYRGHSKRDWKLQSGYARLRKAIPETTLLKKFKQNAAFLLEQKPDNSFDWLFLMQHYGVPTRLLDWTESPLAALYFAVEDEKYKNYDGALWLLFPSALNKNANIEAADEEFYIPSFDDSELISYSVETLSQEKKTKNLPIAAIATRNNPRIQAQLGVFTIIHRDNTPIESIGNKKHAIKYEIPKSAKVHICNELKVLGINKFQLFPELSSIGENLRENLK
ncbi:MAG: FRG domain-containing protein [Nitrospirota bacterium]